MPAVAIDGNLDLQNVNKLINVPTPTAAGDAVPKSYADSIAQGVIFKPAVLAKSTGANVSLTAPGATLDGVTLVNPSRILLTDQTTASQNGIWIWTGAAAALARPTGADDYTTGSTAQPGTSVFVEQGTLYASSIWTFLGTANIVVDTGAAPFTQTNGTADVTYAAPLSKSGNTVSIATPISVANGGTGGNTAAAARTNLGTIGKFAATLGDGSTTTFVVTHNLGSADVEVQVLDMATGNWEIVGVQVTGVNTVSVGPFGTAPAAAGGALGSGTGKRVVVTG